MAKLYYGDENNTAVEINVKGDPGPGVAAGGTAGQVLSKVDGTDYNTQWIDPPGGNDPDAIKKDGTTVTTARIPFAKGVGIDSDNYWTERDFVSLTSSDTGGYTQIQNSNGNVAALYATKPDGSAINNGVKVEPDGLQIMANEETGTSGQVLTAKGDGTCEWGDAAGGGGNVTFSEHVGDKLVCLQLKVPNATILMFAVRSEIAAGTTELTGTFTPLDGAIYPDVSLHIPAVDADGNFSVIRLLLQTDGSYTLNKDNDVLIPTGTVLHTYYSI